MPDMPITEADIEAAERLAGLTYTARERAQMVDNLEEQIALTKARREVDLDNIVPMASRFDPRLPGFTMPTQSGVTVEAEDATLPSLDIAFANLPQLSKWWCQTDSN